MKTRHKFERHSFISATLPEICNHAVRNLQFRIKKELFSLKNVQTYDVHTN